MVAIAVAAVISFAWCALATRLGPLLGYLDHPDQLPTLKVHGRPAALLGGVGLFLGGHTGMALAGQLDLGLLLASLVVLLLGLVDDRVRLSPAGRLVGQILAGAILVTGATTPLRALDPAGLVIGVGLVVVAVNAVNLFDGLDALAGSAGLVTAIGIWVLGTMRGAEIGFALIIAASVAGFLVWNLPPARVFMGDHGAYVLGVFLSYAILLATPRGSIGEVTVAACLLGVFLLDLIATVLRRWRNHRPLFAGDRSHLYDQLRDRGLPIPMVVLIAAALEGGVVLVVVAADRIPAPWALMVLALLGLGAVGALAAGGFLRVDSRGPGGLTPRT